MAGGRRVRIPITRQPQLRGHAAEPVAVARVPRSADVAPLRDRAPGDYTPDDHSLIHPRIALSQDSR